MKLFLLVVFLAVAPLVVLCGGDEDFAPAPAEEIDGGELMSDDIGLYDMPPASEEETRDHEELRDLEIWPNREDEYGPIGNKAIASTLQNAIQEDSTETDGAVSSVRLGGRDEQAPTDLLDVQVHSLLGETSNRKFSKLRSLLTRLRRKLVPLHNRICRSSFQSCLTRRRANARILRNIVARGCHVRRRCSSRRKVVKRKSSNRRRKTTKRKSRRGGRRKQRSSSCDAVGSCFSRSENKLKNVSRVYSYLRRTYSRLYIRYAMLIARFYRRKFKVLTNIFVRTIQQLRWEANKVNQVTRKLKEQLRKYKIQSSTMRSFTAREHKNLLNRIKKATNEHRAAVDKTAKAVAGVSTQLLFEQGVALRLKKQLDDLNAKLKQQEDYRAQIQRDKDLVAKQITSLNNAIKDLLNQIGTTSAQLRDANIRIKNLEQLKNALLAQRTTLRNILSDLNAKTAANQRAIDRIQASYNDLNNRFTKISSSNAGVQKEMQDTINSLRAQIGVQKQRCFPDACGVCNGDETTCAYTRSRSTCYAVGDPHLRTFDGLTYDWQVDGQFVYVWHGNPVNFEVQQMQRPCCGANSFPRYVKGLAVRGGKNVVTMYSHWFTNAILVNGRQVVAPMQQWQRVGPGLSIYRAHGREMLIRYESRGQVATVTARAWGAYMDNYVDVPWEWSSGRSLWGFCGDFDGWVGNDRLWIDRNWQRRFTVTNSRRDLFANPNPNNIYNNLEMNDHTDEEILQEKQWDKVNGVAAPEDLEEYSGDELEAPSPVVTTPLPKNLEADGPKLGPITADMRRQLEEKCKGSHGTAKKQCMFDILNGIAGAKARRSLRTANMFGKEKALKRCMAVDPGHFAMFDAVSLPRPETKQEGTSLFFWWKPVKNDASRCILLEKGKSFFATQVGNSLSVGAGTAQCTADLVFTTNKWTAVTISIHESGSLQVFIDGAPVCAAPDQDVNTMDTTPSPLIVGGADGSDSCVGLMAHLYYIPQVVTRAEAGTHGKIDPFNCQRPVGDNDADADDEPEQE